MKTVAEEVREHGISANAVHPGGRVDVDGRGGQSPDVVVPLILHLSAQVKPIFTGQTLKAKDWNERKLVAAGKGPAFFEPAATSVDDLLGPPMPRIFG